MIIGMVQEIQVMVVIIMKNYKLKNNMKVIDVGCGKGFLLHDLKQELPSLNVYGLDISKYALQKALPDS